MKDFKDLLVEHDFYCSESNYFSGKTGDTYTIFDEFLFFWSDSDVDMNLVFRWDIKSNDDNSGYYMEIFIIQQRKGIFYPIHIENVDEGDFDKIVKYLKPHYEKMKNIWKPF